MAALSRSLVAPLLSLVLLIFASGLFTTFISVRLELGGFDVETIGLVTSAAYVGILIGSLKSGKWISRLGHVRSFVLFALSLTGLILLQAIWVDPWFWAALRLLGGICMAGVFVVIESWLLLEASSAQRGGILSVYLAVFYGALSAGQLLIQLVDPSGISPFIVTAALTAASVLPLSLQSIEAPKFSEPNPIKLFHFFKLSPLGFMGGVISGMLLAVLYGLLPVYASQIGLPISQIGFLMAVLIFGGLSLQWPIGRWADRGNRRFVLNIASFLSAILGLCIALQEPINFIALFLLIGFFGGFSFTLYPLSMAYVCEKIEESQIVSATSGFVLSYGIGAIAGPLFGAFAMEHLGPTGLFYFLFFITAMLGCFGLYPSRSLKAASEKIEE